MAHDQPGDGSRLGEAEHCLYFGSLAGEVGASPRPSEPAISPPSTIRRPSGLPTLSAGPASMAPGLAMSGR